MEFDGEFDLAQMTKAADKASALMKTLGHKGRLMVLCQLANGEKSVGELSETLGIPQSPLSQHLSRMRKEGLVGTRREAQTIFYSLIADDAGKIIECLYGLYCAPDCATD
jgi:DNA-binding transcriptional ArsR family regulator